MAAGCEAESLLFPCIHAVLQKSGTAKLPGTSCWLSFSNVRLAAHVCAVHLDLSSFFPHLFRIVESKELLR